jgi:hypothetical protein
MMNNRIYRVISKETIELERELEKKIKEAMEVPEFLPVIGGIQKYGFFTDLLFDKEKKGIAYIAERHTPYSDRVKIPVQSSFAVQSSLGGALNEEMMYPRTRHDGAFMKLLSLEITKEDFLVGVMLEGSEKSITYNLKKQATFEELDPTEQMLRRLPSIMF